MPPTRKDLIHRDVKPANILITGQDHVYLTDFGLTKHASSISGLTQDGPVGGHGGLHGAGADRGNARDAADRRVLAGLRALRGTDGADALQAGERPRDALGARVCAAAVGARGRAGRAAQVSRQSCSGRWPRTRRSAMRPRASSVAPRLPPPSGRQAPARERQGAGSRSAEAESRRFVLHGGAPAGGCCSASQACCSWSRLSWRSCCSLDRMSQSTTERAASAPSSPLRAASTWRRLPPMPTARQNMASTVLDGTVWVVGGLGERFNGLAPGRGL